MNPDASTEDCLRLLGAAATFDAHRRALERATGETFNLFHVLGIGHLEVRTHSPIIGELLNPKGTHGQGAVFLKRFLEIVKITDLDPERCSLHLEYYVGRIDGDSGGRIDLVIRDEEQPSKAIVIENKIYAGDQEKQLIRYRNAFPEAHLFYLTRFRSPPDNTTDADEKSLNYRRISYRDEIFEWLEACKREATSLPGLREMIGQYLHLIADLTERSISKTMNKHLIEEVLRTPENLSALYTLCDGKFDVEQELIVRLDKALDETASKLGLTRDKPIQDLHDKDSVFSFRMPCLDGKNLRIAFTFEVRGYREFCFGFCVGDRMIQVPEKERLLQLFSDRFGFEEANENWPAWGYFREPYRNWGPDAFKAIESGAMLSELEKKLREMMEIAERFDAAAPASTMG